MTTRNSPLRINKLSRITRTLFRQHHHGVGLFVLIATLFVLSFLAGLQPPMQFRVFMAGEVADSDVVAHRSLTVEDTEAAKIKRNQVAMLQPTVFDLSVTEIAALRQKIFGMLKLINGQETSPEAQDALRASLAEKLATPVSADLLAQWMSPEVHIGELDVAQIDIVVEAVLGGGAKGEVSLGVQALDSLRHDVSSGVADNMQFLVLRALVHMAVFVDDLHNGSPFDES